MFTARITRKVEERIVKEEIKTEDLVDLLHIMNTVYTPDEGQILEIHIVREKLWNG